MMKFERYEWVAITIMISLFIFVGFIQGWSVSLVILNMCIISDKFVFNITDIKKVYLLF